MARQAERDARRIERTRAPWAAGLVHLIHASAASIRGDRDRAVALVGVAERAFEASDMAHFANVCRRARGELVGGADGRALVATADRWMSARQVVNPGRIAGLLAPGAWST